MGLLLFGLVFRGPILVVGLAALVLSLLYWGAEAMRDYDHATSAQSSLPAVVHPDHRPASTCPGRPSGRSSPRSP